MTGVIVTDETLASRTGLTRARRRAGSTMPVATYGERLPPIVAPDAIVGPLTSDAARALGLRADGARDRRRRRPRVRGARQRRVRATRRWCRGGRRPTCRSRIRARSPRSRPSPRCRAGAHGRLRGGSRPVGGRCGGGVARVHHRATHDELFEAAAASRAGRGRRARAAVVRRRPRPVVARRRARRVHRAHRRARARPSSPAVSSRASRSTWRAASS